MSPVPPAVLPAVVVFDVNETLSDLGPLAESFERVGLGADEVGLWFAGVLRDGFALTAAGTNPAFSDVASESLRVRLASREETRAAVGSDVESAVETVMGAFQSLAAHPDVVPGVRALRELGVRLVTLSNGSRSVAEGLLQRAGLDDDFEQLLSVEDAPRWKPHPDSYAYALSRCGVSAEEAMLVAVHPWDVDGAARAGLRSGWLNRNGAPYPSHFTPPDLQAADLVGLAQQLA